MLLIKLIITLSLHIGIVSGPTNLTNNNAGDFEPIWSPNGKLIAFYSDRNPGNKCPYKIY